MNETAEQTFREWLAEQVHRQDAAGRLARDVASEEKRIERALTSIDTRRGLRFYARAIPRSVGLTVDDALEVWKEWLASRQ
jgi:hypothetical protein